MPEQSSNVPSQQSLFPHSSDVTMNNCTIQMTTHNHPPGSSLASAAAGPGISSPDSLPLALDHHSGVANASSQAPIPIWPEIYQRQTQKFNMGYALWDPRPDQTVSASSYQRDGLDIGDVGMITSKGNFHYYFNMALQGTDAKNHGRTPRNFTHFKLSSHDTGATHPPVSSNLLTSVKLDLDRNRITSPRADETCDELKFSGSTNDCHEAVIIYVGGGFQGKALELSTEKKVREWVHAHAYEWYRHLMSRPNSIVNGDLRVIIGYEKTTYWASATFTRSGAESNATGNFSLRLKVFDRPHRDSRCVWDHNGAIWPFTSVGAGERNTATVLQEGEGLSRNQAIFVKAITVTLSDDEWERLESDLARAVQISEESHQTGSGTPTSGESTPKPKQSKWFRRFTGFGQHGKPTAGARRTDCQCDLSASFSSDSTSGGSDGSRDYYDYNSDSDTLCGDGFSVEKPPHLDHTCNEAIWRGTTNHPCSLLNKALLKRVIMTLYSSKIGGSR
ncbi:hypothetical protein D9619_008056 [Psilocybe cf. subviscida]|uniref:Uncharacterized protein n=1 Tax=Psilocybe cf. subviscida TaxID=2480587 RepID=A0A8H5AU46_9AGAR|nr:hypothetical protein D9619_008056 [Psilocybe cf. subviscida]